MPHKNKSIIVRYIRPFCNEIISDLVKNRFISESRARKITEEQFDSSALSEQYVLSLVYQRKISVEKALSMSQEAYFQTALSYGYIQYLVDREIISVNRALSITRDEVENPIPYLTELGESRTPEQNRKLHLYESELGITPDYVEHIVSLEFQQGGRDLVDDRELELLLNPGLRQYASDIIHLEFFSEKNPKTSRELDLIFSPYSRPYADLIADLEFKENKSTDEEIRLENLYLRVCCKLPRKNPIYSLFQSIMDDDVGPRGCHEQVYFGGGVGYSVIQNDASEHKHMEQMKTVIERAANEIVMGELEVRGVPIKLRETEAMKQYVLLKTDLVRHALMKYFAGAPFPYSKEALDAVKEKVVKKISDKKLTLSDKDKLLSLLQWIEEAEQPHENQVLQD